VWHPRVPIQSLLGETDRATQLASAAEEIGLLLAERARRAASRERSYLPCHVSISPSDESPSVRPTPSRPWCGAMRLWPQGASFYTQLHHRLGGHQCGPRTSKLDRPSWGGQVAFLAGPSLSLQWTRQSTPRPQHTVSVVCSPPPSHTSPQCAGRRHGGTKPTAAGRLPTPSPPRAGVPRRRCAATPRGCSFWFSFSCSLDTRARRRGSAARRHRHSAACPAAPRGRQRPRHRRLAGLPVA